MSLRTSYTKVHTQIRDIIVHTYVHTHALMNTHAHTHTHTTLTYTHVTNTYIYNDIATYVNDVCSGYVQMQLR